MKLILPLLLALSSAANVDEAVEKEATLTMAHQHMVVNFLSAVYYCKNQRWPESIETVRSFKESEGVPLPVEANWQLLQSPSFSFEWSTTVVVRSIQGAVPGSHAIISTNSPPGCQGRNIDIKANMHIGD
jgi:hypothetical protein